jgi:hypothetical protein
MERGEGVLEGVEMNRREFTGALFGLPFLFQERAVDYPAWYARALARMRELGRCGLVMVAPEGAKERVDFGRSIYALTELEDDGADAQTLLCETVPIVMTAALAKRWLPGEGNRILLAPDGQVLARDVVAPAAYASPAAFAASFRLFVHGPRDERLHARAAALETPEVQALLRKLASPDERIGAVLELGRSAEKLTPVLARAALEVEDAGKQARLILRRHFATLPKETPGATLPYGSHMGKFYNSCGHYVPAESENVMACGMARAPRRSGKFITLLAE